MLGLDEAQYFSGKRGPCGEKLARGRCHFAVESVSICVRIVPEVSRWFFSSGLALC